MEVLKYYLKPTENKLIATVIIFCVYLVYSTFILSISENIFGPILLFFLYLFGGPAAFVYMWTTENSTEFISVILFFLAVYQYLITCLFSYFKERFTENKPLLKPRSFKF